MSEKISTPGMDGKASPMKGPMTPTTGGMYSNEKAKDFKGTLRKLIAHLAQYKLAFFIVLIFSVLSTTFTILGPKILGNATTTLFDGIISKLSGTGEGVDFVYIGSILVFLLVLYILSALFGYIQGLVMTHISMKTTYTLRRELAQKINSLPISYFDKTSTGDILSRVTNDIDTLNQTINQSITQIISSVATIVGIFIMMISISWQMTLVATLIVPVALVFIFLVIKKSQKYFTSQQEYLGLVNGHVEEMYSGHTVVKAFNGEEESIRVFDKFNDTLYTSAWKSQFLSGLMMPVMMFVSNLGYVAICILGGYLAINRGLSVGDIQAFIQYVRQFTQPISQLANISNILQQTTAAAERVFEFLDEPEETPDTNQPLCIRPGSGVTVNGSVEFKHVCFGYTPDKIIINNLNLKVLPGHKIAIVGPTGAGKTTIVKLLMRFYDLNSGDIFIDGHNITDFTRNDLRSIFGMVLQDTWLYNASIMDNIRYGRLDATNNQVIAAAKAAQVDHFVRTLPDSYDMVLNEEINNISQGQKQLLTIARAIIADPKILILDEATSSVDTRTEVLIQAAMTNLMKDRTSFVIAHRLSTIKDADLILVMNHGDVIEQGTHTNLIAKDGFYAKLYNSQFENN